MRRSEKIELENINHPGQVRRVDARTCQAMKRAFLKILPDTTPGLTVAEIQERVIAHLPEDLFPGGARAGWWTKAVQFDLEAKGIISREKTRPLRLRKEGDRDRAAKPTGRAAPRSIDEYVASFPPAVRAILEKIRFTIRTAAPDAQETISYKIPAYTLNGVLVYFAAFRNHIGFYPPVRGDKKLDKALSPYAGPKGNLRFPLDEPVPYGVIETIVKLRMKQNLSKTAPDRSSNPNQKKER
jgi:uncharacterized protein YdhG (YjbR/CyaY superfamily)